MSEGIEQILPYVQNVVDGFETAKELVASYETAMRAALLEIGAALLHCEHPATEGARLWLVKAEKTLQAALPDDAAESD